MGGSHFAVWLCILSIVQIGNFQRITELYFDNHIVKEGDSASLTCTIDVDVSETGGVTIFRPNSTELCGRMAGQGPVCGLHQRCLSEGRYRTSCVGRRTIILNILSVSQPDRGMWECGTQGIDRYSDTVELILLVQPLPPEVINAPGPEEEMGVGEPSLLGCRQSNEASPVPTLSWFRQLPGGSPELLNYQTGDNVSEIVYIEHYYSHQDHGAEFYCEAAQPEVNISTPAQSERIQINIKGSLSSIEIDHPYVLVGDAVSISCNLISDISPGETILLSNPQEGACAQMTRTNAPSTATCILLPSCMGGNYTANCDGNTRLVFDISEVTETNLGYWNCSMERVQGSYREMPLQKFELAEFIEILNTRGDPHGALENQASDLICKPDPEANPLSTLTWFRKDNTTIDMINQESSVPPLGGVQLNYTYSLDDEGARLFCISSQPDSLLHSQDIQSNIITIELFYPSEAPVGFDLSPQLVNVGEPVEMACTMTMLGHPAVTQYNWIRDGIVLESTAASTVIITPDHLDYSAEFSCSGSSFPAGLPVLTSAPATAVNLTVHVPPTILYPLIPVEQSRNIDDSEFELLCTAGGEPYIDPSTISWFKDGIQISVTEGTTITITNSSVEDGLYGLKTGYHSLLHINVTEATVTCDDIASVDGIYTCGLPQSQSAAINITTLHQPFWRGTPWQESYSIREGKDFSLDCSVCMNPHGVHNWYHNITPIIDESWVNGDTLFISGVSEDDRGTFTCEVINNVNGQDYLVSFSTELHVRTTGFEIWVYVLLAFLSLGILILIIILIIFAVRRMRCDCACRCNCCSGACCSGYCRSLLCCSGFCHKSRECCYCRLHNPWRKGVYY